MDQTILLIILVAGSVALAFISISMLVGDAVSGEKRKLQQRLASENRMLQPDAGFTKQIRRKIELTGWSGRLIKLPGMASIHRALEQAWPKLSLAKFVGIAAGLGVGGLIFAWGIFDSLLLAVVIGGGLGFLPWMILSMRRNRRQTALIELLPDALDFLGRILRAGHSLSTGLQMVGQELPEPLAGEFRRAYDAHSLGLPLDEALKDTAARIGSSDFGFFVTAILIQRQTGGDLSEVLDNISLMVRNRIRLQQHVKAKTAEGRLTGYILTGFPAVMFFLSYAMNPKYAGLLLSGTGLYLLGIAAGLCVIGLYAIRKITAVKV
ncbi:MAG TPA: type II secretion system F family protein [Tepidisphaeraceae bacterium]|nr:type II secretion system F family protein [Tepidisphaeraceae bacterium]